MDGLAAFAGGAGGGRASPFAGADRRKSSSARVIWDSSSLRSCEACDVAVEDTAEGTGDAGVGVMCGERAGEQAGSTEGTSSVPWWGRR